MRISGKTILLTLCGLAAIFLFSCKTAQSTGPVNPETGEKEAVEEKKPEYTRIAFGEQLDKLLTEGKYDEAIALFDTVPEPDASDLSIKMLKLSILISAGKKEESTALATELETLYPDNADILYIQAILAGARNDKTSRTKYLNAVLKVQPKHSQAMTALGLDLLERKNYTQAKGWLIKAISADPENSDALLGLARVYYMEAELAKAGSTLNLAIGKTPDYSVLWAERARVKSESRDLPGAIDDIKKAIDLDPRVYGHWTDYGNYLISAGKKQESREAFSEAIKLKPEYYLAYIYRAGLNDDLGNTDEAISDYTKVCVLLPEYYYAAESLGILLWGKGNYAASGAAFQQALSWSPKNSSYALMATLCLYRDNKGDEAKKFMSKYITTMDRTKTDYFLCRLFVDKSGDADVLNRITKEKNSTTRNRMLFYSAMYYELFQNKAVAQKFYTEVASVPSPGFFEYRLSKWALENLDFSSDSASDKPADSGTQG